MKVLRSAARRLAISGSSACASDASSAGDQRRKERGDARRDADHVAEESREERACSARMRSARLPLPSSPLVFAGCAIAGLPDAVRARRMLGRGEDRVDRSSPGPSSTEVRRATSAATSLMRSRSSAFSTRSDAQVASASRFIAETSRCSLARSSRARSSWLSASVFSARSASVAVAVAALDGAELLAQIGLDPARRIDIDAQLVALALAVGEQARLLGQPHFHVGDAAAHDLGFGGLRRELALELADAGAEVLHVAALLGELLGGLLGGVLLARVAFLGVLHLRVPRSAT